MDNTNMIINVYRNFCLVIYLVVAKNIPDFFPFKSFGFLLRRYLCRYIFKDCGINLSIGSHVDFGRGRKLVVGDNVTIGRGSQINLNEMVTLSDGVYIGEDVLIYTQDHGHDRTDIVMQHQPYFKKPVFVGKDARIGPRVIILKGCSIGEGCTIEPGSVVVKQVPPAETVIGIPARPAGG